MDIHQGENCRRLRKLKRNIETVANMHMELPQTRAGAPNRRRAKRLNSGICSLASSLAANGAHTALLARVAARTDPVSAGCAI
jgi:hypothetical protein